MAKFEYHMVYLPHIQPLSFLLFVHNKSEGSNELRDYSSGREQVIGQPGIRAVFDGTSESRTRFRQDAHRVSDHQHWYQVTQHLNKRFLSGPLMASPIAAPMLRVPPLAQAVDVVQGRATRGSRLQLQNYVNDHPEALSRAILERLPSGLHGVDAQIRWVSPLAPDDFREYRDAEFLERVGLGRLAEELAQFWPKGGPSWDALGLIAVGDSPGVILVEAKSYIREIYGNGCQAGSAARSKIAAALLETQRWCGVDADKDWLGPLYQSANRLAHLYFLRERARVPAWLVNLYFVDDPIGPTSAAEWEAATETVKSELGLFAAPSNVVSVWSPALA